MAETRGVTVIDTRLAEGLQGYGGPSVGDAIKVNASTPMPDMMRQIKAKVDYPRIKIGMLIIAAHGYAERGADGVTHDGFGMQLCREDLDMNSVHYFRALEGQFESRDLGLTLVGCGVARQERVKTRDGIKMGFGESLCTAIARLTLTGVVASTDLQQGFSGTVRRRVGASIEDTPVFDPGSWEGAVYIFTPDGAKKKAPPGLLARLVKGSP
ncbi:MAG: hypothetical protein DMD87_13025 [Candidatus Rokuibacteriota bacterium]|nr:MAG: hypothetical protein DMD87_13025 [Candidatus Rokubacteria bacterium]